MPASVGSHLMLAAQSPASQSAAEVLVDFFLDLKPWRVPLLATSSGLRSWLRILGHCLMSSVPSGMGSLFARHHLPISRLVLRLGLLRWRRVFRLSNVPVRFCPVLLAMPHRLAVCLPLPAFLWST